MYKIRSKNVFLNIVVPVNLPGIEVEVVYQMFIYLNKDGEISFDKDLIDLENLKFMGLEVKESRIFFDSQKDIGIDIEELVFKQSENILTEEESQKIADGYLEFFK